MLSDEGSSWFSISEFVDMVYHYENLCHEKLETKTEKEVDENPNLLTVDEMKEWMAEL